MKCLKIDTESGLYSILLNLQDLAFIRKILFKVSHSIAEFEFRARTGCTIADFDCCLQTISEVDLTPHDENEIVIKISKFHVFVIRQSFHEICYAPDIDNPDREIGASRLQLMLMLEEWTSF
jgi:hypothetical protein